MPSKEQIQLLQRLFAYFKRNGGRNIPDGISQIELVDDDDLSRWFVQLTYKDENNADFYVSLELVFSEDGGGDDPVDTFNPKKQPLSKSSVAPPSSSSPFRVDSQPSPNQEVSKRPPSSPVAKNEAAAAVSEPVNEKLASPSGKATADSSALRQPSTRVQPNPSDKNASTRLFTAATEAVARPGAVHRRTRMPLVFIVAPRLIASFIHHGALCSLELMSQYWEPSTDNMTLLLLALHETLNPFSGDGRVSVDDEERTESRRAAAVAGGGMVRNSNSYNNNASSLSTPGAYSAEEHELGIDYIRRAHPHLFRRHVDPTVAVVPSMPPQEASAAEERTATTESSFPFESSPSAQACLDGDGRGVARREKEGKSADKAEHLKGPKNTTTTATGATIGISPHSPKSAPGVEASEATAATGASESHILRDVSRLNTALYDALEYAYSHSTTKQQQNPGSHQQQQATQCPRVRMLLDTAVLLKDTDSDGLTASSGNGNSEANVDEHIRNVRENDRKIPSFSGTTPDNATEPITSPCFPPPAAAAASDASATSTTSLFTPALRAERVLRARPPPASHLAYAPTHSINSGSGNSNAHEKRSWKRKREASIQRVVELWIPRTLPQLPSSGVSRAAAAAGATTASDDNESVESSTPHARSNSNGEAVFQTVRLTNDTTNAAAALCSIEVCLVGGRGIARARNNNSNNSSKDNVNADGYVDDDEEDVEQAPIACLLRNIRVSTRPTRTLASTTYTHTIDQQTLTTAMQSGTGKTAPTPAAKNDLTNDDFHISTPLFRFSLQPSTAPSPSGEVHVCEIPTGLSLRCEHMYLYGHLRVFGSLSLHNCVLVGSITTEEFACVQVTHSQLALMPDDRLLRRALPSLSAASLYLLRKERKRNSTEQASPPPPPALFYAQRKECVLVLDSSKVDITDDSHIYRLIPEMQAAAPWLQRSHIATTTRSHSKEQIKSERAAETQKETEDNDRRGENAAAATREEGERDEGTDFKPGEKEDQEEVLKSAIDAPQNPAQQNPKVAAMMTVLRSLILVSNQGRLRLVRCSIHPGRNTERTIFAEQDAIVDMAYCNVKAAISSGVIIQGCRAFLEHCTFESSAIVEAASENTAQTNDKSTGRGPKHQEQQRQQHLPMRLGDASRSTGLIVELGGTLTARFCTVQHVYFAFCVIAHSVAHLYQCHAENVVNGYTIDASTATLEGCSANTNHVGAFVLRKAKCILTEEHRASFTQRCTLLGLAHDAARRDVLHEVRQQQQRNEENENHLNLVGMSAAAVAARTIRVAALARQYYARYVLHPEVPQKAEEHKKEAVGADAATSAIPSQRIYKSEQGNTSQLNPVIKQDLCGVDAADHQPHFGICGGSFSLEVRDSSLKATGATLINARDTAVYAVDDSTIEMDNCLLWSTAEVEDAAVNAADAETQVAAAEADKLAVAFNSPPSSAPVAAAAAGAEKEMTAPPQLEARHQQQQQQQPGRQNNSRQAVMTGSSAAPVGKKGVKDSLTTSSALSNSPRPSSRPRQSSCGMKTVHSTLKARRCLMTGFSFGVGAIQSSNVDFMECMAAHCMNGFTIDHSKGCLKNCGADASHVGIFALNNATVEVEGVPHVVGVSSKQRTPPLLICGGVPAVFGGDAYGVECKSSEMRCYGITVPRGRDSGFNVYSKSCLTLSKCLVDPYLMDATRYILCHAKRLETLGEDEGEGCEGRSSSCGSQNSNSSADKTDTSTNDPKGRKCRKHKRANRKSADADNGSKRSGEEREQVGVKDTSEGTTTGSQRQQHRQPDFRSSCPITENWLHSLTLDVCLADLDDANRSGDAPLHDTRDDHTSKGKKNGGSSTRNSNVAIHSPPPLRTANRPTTSSSSPSSTQPDAHRKAAAVSPVALTSGVKVWSGSRCVAEDSEVRSVTFGFAALGPGTYLEAHHCMAKHVVNGFTADGGVMQLTKCSASSNHVGVYVLSHGRCVVRDGSYKAKKYGIESRSGVLSFHGHVKIHGFSRVGLYLYAGAHCEAEEDSVLDIRALRQDQHESAAAAQTDKASTSSGSTKKKHKRNCNARSTSPQSIYDSPLLLTPTSTSTVITSDDLSSTSPDKLEEAANVSDLLPACIALDEATAHLPQAILGGGARCGVTCADGATGFIGQCTVSDCTLVGVNVFPGAHLTLANCQLNCAQRHAVVVHVGGVCRIIRQESDVHSIIDNDEAKAGVTTAAGRKATQQDGTGTFGKEERESGVCATKRDLRRLRQEELRNAATPVGFHNNTSLISTAKARFWNALRRTAGRAVPPSLLRWWGTSNNAPSLSVAALANHSSNSDNTNNNGGDDNKHADCEEKGRTALTPGTAQQSSLFSFPSTTPPSGVREGGATTLSLLHAAMTTFTAAAAAHDCGTARTINVHTNSTKRPDTESSDQGKNDEGRKEIGGRRRLPFTRDTRQHLRWLTYDTHRLPLVFRMNPLVSGGVGSAGELPLFKDNSSSSTIVRRATTIASRNDANENVNSVEKSAQPANQFSSPVRMPQSPLPFATLPPVQPAIIGSIVIRGTCTIERMLLRPTDLKPSTDKSRPNNQNEEKNANADTRNGEIPTSAEVNKSARDGSDPDVHESGLINGVPNGATVTGDATQPPPPSSLALVHNLMTCPPAIHVCQHGVLNLSDCLVDTSLASKRDAKRVETPNEKAQKPNSDGTGHHDFSSSVVTVICEGPYARLHCDHVRVLQCTDDNTASNESGNSREEVVFCPSPVESFHSCSAEETDEEKRGTVEMSAHKRTTAAASAKAQKQESSNLSAPLLFLSLREGAQCTLHMVGTALDTWPYSAYESIADTKATVVKGGHGSDAPFLISESVNNSNSASLGGVKRKMNDNDDDGDDADETASTSADRKNQSTESRAEVTQKDELLSLTSTSDAPCHKGIMLWLSNGSLAEASFSSFTRVEVCQKGMVRFVNCVMKGNIPLLFHVRERSCARLLFCRVLDTQQTETDPITGAMPATPPAIRIDATSHLLLFRTEVRKTSTPGNAVMCDDGGRLTQMESHVASFGNNVSLEEATKKALGNETK